MVPSFNTIKINGRGLTLIFVPSRSKFLDCFFQGDDGLSNQKAVEERKRETEDMKNSILSQILDQFARARCE